MCEVLEEIGQVQIANHQPSTACLPLRCQSVGCLILTLHPVNKFIHSFDARIGSKTVKEFGGEVAMGTATDRAGMVERLATRQARTRGGMVGPMHHRREWAIVAGIVFGHPLEAR
jgi:hypothetical protein